MLSAHPAAAAPLRVGPGPPLGRSLVTHVGKTGCLSGLMCILISSYLFAQ